MRLSYICATLLAFLSVSSPVHSEAATLSSEPHTAAEASSERRTRVSFRDQGIERTAWLYLPEASGELPLVVVLHGYGGKALNDGIRFMELADKYGFAVCWPQGAEDGTGHSCWNVGYPFQADYRIDDCLYLRRLIRRLQRDFGISRRNLFLTGMSNGGEMCYKMAAEHPETFSAIASVAGLTLTSMSVDYRRPVPFLEIHGTEDRVSEWNGDPCDKGGWGAYLAVPAAVAHIVSANCCVSYSASEIPSSGRAVVLHSFSGGLPAWKNGPASDVLLYEVKGGDHSWSESYVDTCALIWNFFSRYLR